MRMLVWTSRLVAGLEVGPAKCIFIGDVQTPPTPGMAFICRQGFSPETIEELIYDPFDGEIHASIESADTENAYGKCLYKKQLEFEQKVKQEVAELSGPLPEPELDTKSVTRYIRHEGMLLAVMEEDKRGPKFVDEYQFINMKDKYLELLNNVKNALETKTPEACRIALRKIIAR